MNMRTRERIELHLLDDNPWQPRQAMDQESIEELADNIHQIGLLQVPLARRSPTVSGRFQVAFGHRRVAACRFLHQRADWPSYIEMDVAEITDEKMAVIALSENERRKQLTAIEVVRAHKRAIDETELSVQSLATQLGMDRSTLANNLRVLGLPDFVLEHVESGALRLSVARAFLVLQNPDHAHTEDMQAVVGSILNPYYGRGGLPDWRRSNVRRAISQRVAYNETEYRPLGPRQGSGTAGASREATFDVDTFAAERPKSLHTIPASESHDDKHEGSRLWTCDVKAWRSWQTRATREANKEAGPAGASKSGTTAKPPSRDKEFEQLLANDPVWKQVIASRKKRGPNRPVTDEEREQLGSRAEFREVPSYGQGFWKVMQKADPDYPRLWEQEHGGGVAPWFPDLEECQKCTIGAAYAKSRGGYPLSQTALVCFNREHYQEKLAAGEIAYREKLDAQRRGSDRQDSQTVERLTRQLEPLSDDACRALAASLLTARRALEWQHPLGVFHQEWSYESGPIARIRELPGLEDSTYERRDRAGLLVDVDSLDGVAAEHLPELVAALVTHHLRQAGKMQSVSPETPAESLATEAA